MPEIDNLQLTKQKTSADRMGREFDAVEFPSARYFQIHFEHLYAELLNTRTALEDLKQQIQALNGLDKQNR